jgi:ribosomal protein S12 methylthiotransferase
MNVTNLTVNGRRGTMGVGYFESDRARLRLTPRHYAYLRLSEGCNQNCTFCTIPSIRGKMRSKPINSLHSEAEELLADGAFELNLIGQDTTSYGDDLQYKPGLVGALTCLNEIARKSPRGAWLRLMYAYPSCFADEMIDAIAQLDHVVKYVDMPLQHISDRLLTSMRRNTSRAQTIDVLNKLRERVPGIAIRTTMITGFPGETEDDHEELLDFIGEFCFDMLGVFQYSPEPGTPAFKLEQDPDLVVPAEIKQRRHDEIMELQQSIAFEQAAYMASLFHQPIESASGDRNGVVPSEALPAAIEASVQFDVLIDEIDESGGTGEGDSDAAQPWTARAQHTQIGRCYFQAPQVDSKTCVRSQRQLQPGELVRCAIVDSDGYDLIAMPVDEMASLANLADG